MTYLSAGLFECLASNGRHPC